MRSPVVFSLILVVFPLLSTACGGHGAGENEIQANPHHRPTVESVENDYALFSVENVSHTTATFHIERLQPVDMFVVYEEGSNAPNCQTSKKEPVSWVGAHRGRVTFIDFTGVSLAVRLCVSAGSGSMDLQLNHTIDGD